jgi:hypothetical protein
MLPLARIALALIDCRVVIAWATGCPASNRSRPSGPPVALATG